MAMLELLWCLKFGVWWKQDGVWCLPASVRLFDCIGTMNPPLTRCQQLPLSSSGGEGKGERRPFPPDPAKVHGNVWCLSPAFVTSTPFPGT